MLGSLSSLLFFYIESLSNLIAVTLVSGVCFGSSFVFYYAYLPHLTRNHPSRLAAVELSGGRKNTSSVLKIEERVANGMSSKGMSYGYASGVGVLICCAFIVQRLGQTVKRYFLLLTC